MITQAINIIFDGPPGHDTGQFVEVETDDGKSIKIGKWVQKGNYWALRIAALPTQMTNDEYRALEEAGCPYCGSVQIEGAVSKQIEPARGKL